MGREKKKREILKLLFIYALDKIQIILYKQTVYKSIDLGNVDESRWIVSVHTPQKSFSSKSRKVTKGKVIVITILLLPAFWSISEYPKCRTSVTIYIYIYIAIWPKVPDCEIETGKRKLQMSLKVYKALARSTTQKTRRDFSYSLQCAVHLTGTDECACDFIAQRLLTKTDRVR